MTKKAIIFILLLALNACKKDVGNVCFTCYIEKHIHSKTVSIDRNDTVIHCGAGSADIGKFVRDNRVIYQSSDSSNLTRIKCVDHL